MPTLIELRNQQNKIIEEVINNEGIFSEESNYDMEQTQTAIAHKVDAYAYVLKEDIPQEIEYWKKRKEEADSMIKRIINNKERMQQLLHAVSSDVLLEGEYYTITPTMSKTSTINIDKVENNIGTIEVTIPFFYLNQLVTDLSGEDLKFKPRKILLKDLPEGHPAIEQELRPTISITKSKKR